MLAARLASVTARLGTALGESATFRAVPITALFDRSPKPEKLPAHLLDLEDGVQPVVVTLPLAGITAPPRVEEYIHTATHRHRIQSVRFLGHAYECACTLSTL